MKNGFTISEVEREEGVFLLSLKCFLLSECKEKKDIAKENWLTRFSGESKK